MAKVSAANTLYRFAIEVLLVCFSLGIYVSIENPSRSWLWGILTQLVLQQNDSAFTEWYTRLRNVDFHVCMHGGERNKRTRFLSSPGLYDALEAECDQSHTHKPWFVLQRGAQLEFATAMEAEYPKTLCTRMANCLRELALQYNVQLGPQLSSTQRAKHAWGVQTIKAKPLIPEFKDFHHSPHEDDQPGFRLLATPSPGVQNTELLSETEQHELDERGEDIQKPKRVRKMYKYGIQWRPEEFLLQAKQTTHPKDPQRALPLALKEAILHVMTTSPVEVAKHRLSVILALHRKAAELGDSEKELKQSMDGNVAAVLSCKRLLLWKYLMEITHFSDTEVFNLVVKGIPLHGAHSKPPNFPDDWRPATVSVDELLSSALWRRKSLMSMADHVFDEKVQQDLHEATMKEVSLGNLQGPFTENEVSEYFGTPDWLFNPRFALYQGSESKVRAIDDGKRSSLNAAYTTNFKLELYDVDTLAAMLASIADSLEGGEVNFDLDNDTYCSMPVHRDVASDSWVGRTLDLSRAYKQLAVDPSSRLLNVIGYFHQGAWKFYRSEVLPFGAVASVYSFNRVSRSLHHIICGLLWSMSTCFYDDFPTISPCASSSVLTKAMSVLLNLLGWDHARVGSKAVDFASDFSALGISVQLTSLNKGSFILCNKEGRIERLCAMLQAIKERGLITKSEAAQVQGHLNFASGFFVSKALRFLVSAFNHLAEVPRLMGSVDLGKLCSLAISMLQSMPPREYRADSFKNPFLIFTDGAWENGKASGGALVFDPDRNTCEVFAVKVPDRLVSCWLEQVGDQLISQIEFFVYLAVRFQYRRRLHNKIGIAWIDNEAARFVAIKGSSGSFTMFAMSRTLQQLELEMPSSVWLERVCSYSNPSDMPSRDQVHQAAILFRADERGVLEVPEHIVDAILLIHRDPYASLNALTTGVNSSA